MGKTALSLSLTMAAMLLAICSAAPCADVCCDPSNSDADFRTRCESSNGLTIRCRQFDGCQCSSDYCFGDTARPGTLCVPRAGQDTVRCRVQFSCDNCDALGSEAPCFDGRDVSACPKADPGLGLCSGTCKLDCSGSPGLAQERCIDDKTGSERTCNCFDLAPAGRNPLFLDIELENCVFPTSFFDDELKVLASLKNVGLLSMTARTGNIQFQGDVLDSTICRVSAAEDVRFEGSVGAFTSLVVEAGRFNGELDIQRDFVDSQVGTLKASRISVRGSFSGNKVQVMFADQRIIVRGEIRLSRFENFHITGQPSGGRFGDQVLDLQPGAAFEDNEIESFSVNELKAFSNSRFTDNNMGFVILHECTLSSLAVGEGNSFERRLVTDEVACEDIFQ